MICTFAMLAIAQTVDPAALKLLGDADSRLQQIRSLTATCVYTMEHAATKNGPSRGTRIKSDLRFMRPNLAFAKCTTSKLVKGSWSPETSFETIACDGQTSWQAEDWDGRINAAKANPKAEDIHAFFFGPLYKFFLADDKWTKYVDALNSEGKMRALSLAPTASWNGQSYRVVRLIHEETQSTVLDTIDFYIDKDNLICRTSLSKSDGSTVITGELQDVHINDALPKSAFVYYPPSSYKEGTGVILNRPPDDRIGKPAPALSVNGLDGKTVSLSDFKGRTIILDFWASWCGNCTAGMPDMDKLAAKYKSRNVVFLAIDSGDTQAKYRDWLRHHKYPNLTFAFDPDGSIGKGSYGAYKAGFPSTFVVDGKGDLADVDPDDLQKSIDKCSRD